MRHRSVSRMHFAPCSMRPALKINKSESNSKNFLGFFIIISLTYTLNIFLNQKFEILIQLNIFRLKAKNNDQKCKVTPKKCRDRLHCIYLIIKTLQEI